MLTLDPYRETILDWKIIQNAVVSRFLQAWFTADPDTKAALPYDLEVGDVDQPKYILYRERRVCQFEIIQKECLVLWCRSVLDLNALDAAIEILLGGADASTADCQHQPITTSV